MSEKWYIRFPGGKWIPANEHQKDAVKVLMERGGNAQTINVKHTMGGCLVHSLIQ
jgi:hypothetical protein